MSEALIQRIKELEVELQKLRSQLKDGSRTEHELSATTNPSAGRTADHKPSGDTAGSKKSKKGGKDRPFVFSAHPRRHVALRLAYLGWAYQGFAVQENTDNTVEARLFEALQKTRLIHDRESSNYHRCGRTDKGVSAFSQVASLRCIEILSYITTVEIERTNDFTSLFPTGNHHRLAFLTVLWRSGRHAARKRGCWRQKQSHWS